MNHKEKWYFSMHKKLWHWLERNPGASKSDWPGWKDIKQHITNDCFLCGYYEIDCAYCPLGGNTYNCMTEGVGLYDAWLTAKGITNPTEEQLKAISEIARQIKNAKKGGKLC